MTMTLRQKRLREVQNSLARTEAQREAMIAGLIRSEVKLKALRKQKDRLERIMAKPAPTQEPAPKPAPTSHDALEIPVWLQRSDPTKAKLPVDHPGDMEARIAIETEQANKRIAKTRARIEKMKAKASGETKRMPLTGRAAMEYLRTGKR